MGGNSSTGDHTTDSIDYYTFTAISDQYWIYSYTCNHGIGTKNQFSCGELSIEKYFNGAYKTISSSDTRHNMCNGIQVKNVTQGLYRIKLQYDNFFCFPTVYSLFLGCFDDNGVVPTPGYDNYIESHFSLSKIEAYSWDDDIISMAHAGNIESNISCGIVIKGQRKEDEKYYEFNIVNDEIMDWISFSTCDQTSFNPILSLYFFDGRLKLDEAAYSYPNGYHVDVKDGSNCVVMNATNLRTGKYYVGINNLHDTGNQFTMNMQCSDDDAVVEATDYNCWDCESTGRLTGVIIVGIILGIIVLIIAVLIVIVYRYKKKNNLLRKDLEKKYKNRSDDKIKEQKVQSIVTNYDKDYVPKGIPVGTQDDGMKAEGIALNESIEKDVMVPAYEEAPPSYNDVPAASAPINNIDNEELRAWFLNDVGLELNEIDEYVHLFGDNGWNKWSIVRNVDKDDLKDIGLIGNKVGNRTKILDAIKLLN